MKKLIFSRFIVSNLLLLLITGCIPLQTQIPSSPVLPSPTTPATSVPTARTAGSFISIAISPYYDSEGTQIDVGKYSEQLKTEDLQILTELADEMAQEKEVLTPEQMYVLAIRLYNLGDRDNSIYWYYEAQFRARLFQQAIEPAQMVSTSDITFLLTTAYDSFQKLAGEYINGYAGCNLDNWAKYTKMVADDNPTPAQLDQIFPDTVFVTPEQWQRINNEVAAGLTKLTNYILENGESIRQQRKQMNMDEKFCK